MSAYRMVWSEQILKAMTEEELNQQLVNEASIADNYDWDSYEYGSFNADRASAAHANSARIKQELDNRYKSLDLSLPRYTVLGFNPSHTRELTTEEVVEALHHLGIRRIPGLKARAKDTVEISLIVLAICGLGLGLGFFVEALTGWFQFSKK